MTGDILRPDATSFMRLSDVKTATRSAADGVLISSGFTYLASLRKGVADPDVPDDLTVVHVLRVQYLALGAFRRHEDGCIPERHLILDRCVYRVVDQLRPHSDDLHVF